ncbi:uncharacterized oxidoreductase ZK1290.5-like [Limulus polyphemus]|uniref:Uncharacterized oxidoreductase ZK1290.5-like n=1 Tax=Limulus polyphemus TaxID=6850 RepID=A0ABM1S9F1_LIMPO|nr:uncharacterized oxidoreductase ZK1290.5-like [Limulus polyphemus]
MPQDVQKNFSNFSSSCYYYPSTEGEMLHYGPSAVVLRNGVVMPILGLGTSHSGGYSHSAVLHALKDCGYRLIDTAKRYGLERYLSEVIKDSEVDRDALFLSSKLWPSDYGGVSARQAFFGSLHRLNTEYLDLFMLHWPECPSSCTNKRQTLEDTWRALEIIFDEGFCNAIGVSNYDVHHLEDLMETCSVVPHVNQVEFHPFQNPKTLRNVCADLGIQVHGYSPLAKGQILDERTIVEVARRNNKTAAQVLIRWSIQNNVVTIPKSTKEHRIRENANVFDFQLSSSDMELLDNLHNGKKVVTPGRMTCVPDRESEGPRFALRCHRKRSKSSNVGIL